MALLSDWPIQTTLRATVALLLVVGPASAGTISINTEITATANQGVLKVTLKVTNSGDEPAASVVPTVAIAGEQLTGAGRKSLAPRQTMEAPFDVPWARP